MWPVQMEVEVSEATDVVDAQIDAYFARSLERSLPATRRML